MRTISKRLLDLVNSELPIGFAGENLHTQVRLDSKRVFDEYPDAVPAIVVTSPGGVSYPAVVYRDGDIVVWNVTNADLAYEGNGELQVSFSVDEVVVKSYSGKTRVDHSIMPNGPAPDPIDDFCTRASAALAEIPQAIENAVDDALEAAKESGEFDGPKGDPGDPGLPGDDGFSPVVTVEQITGGHAVTITDAQGPHSFDVMDGKDGQGGNVIDDTAGTGETGKAWSADKLVAEFDKKYEKPSGGIPATDIANGVIPDVSGLYTKPSGGIPKTDLVSAVQTSLGKADTAYQKPGGGIPAQDLAEGVLPDPTAIIDDTAGTGDTDKVWSADKSAAEKSDVLSALSAKYEKPSTGIPASDLASGVIPSVPVQDVQVNGTSVVSSGVASIPVASDSTFGVAKFSSTYGLAVNQNGFAGISTCSTSDCKGGSQSVKAVTPYMQHYSTFYGLAKAAGDSTQKSSSNAVGTYTEDAKSSISQMLDAPENVSGTTPSITAKAGVRYICGEVATLSITPPASGDMEVIFDSGSTATVLTVPSTVRFPEWFDSTDLESNRTYDIIISNGELGLVTSWA